MKIIQMGRRLAFIVAVAGVLLWLPEPENDSVLHYKNALVVLCTLIASGKTLYDTLFFDRYH